MLLLRISTFHWSVMGKKEIKRVYLVKTDKACHDFGGIKRIQVLFLLLDGTSVHRCYLTPPPPPPTKSMLTKHFKRTEANSTTFRCVLWDHYFKNLTGFFQVFSEIPRLIYILEGSRTVYFSKPTSPFWNIIDLLRKSDVNCFYFVYLIGIFIDRFFSRQKPVCCSLKRGSPLPYLGIMKSDQGTYCDFNIKA